MSLKPSAYNILVPPHGRECGIAYNTRTGTLALASERAISFLLSANAFEDASCIPWDEKTLAAMTAGGFLVDADRNEFIEVEAEHCLLQQDPSVLSLCIAPTYACNLACPYCYEKGRDSSSQKMDRAMQDKVIDFARQAYAITPYERLEVQWYGGEPMLVPEAVEHISAGLIRFCEEHSLGYSAMMISNATRINAEEAAMLKHSCINSVLVTIDGPRIVHNQRRPARDGSDSFDAVMASIERLICEYIDVTAVMNTDRVNDASFNELNEQLHERFGIGITRTKLNDYYSTFGCEAFCEPEFSLMDHAEFTRQQCRRFCTEGHEPQDFARLLQPIPLFCRGQAERYYCIDAVGDVYKCDGHMGRTEHVIFNLEDIVRPEDIPGETAPTYPFDDASCSACNLLPLCKGTCKWERACCTDHPCHPLKYTAMEYLQGWIEALGQPRPLNGEFQVLVAAESAAG